MAFCYFSTTFIKGGIVLQEARRMNDSADVEQLIYRWCTSEARGSHSAQALAAIYASTYMDGARLLRFADLRALDDERLEWAVTLLRGYVQGAVKVPWARAVALVALYELYPNDDEEIRSG
jgi:hypothetical protein